ACPMCEFSTLAEFRLSLTARGIASEDILSDSPAYDVSTEDGYLALHERDLQRIARQPPPPGFRRAAPDVVLAQDAPVDPSASLIGPVVVQQGVCVGSGACVIGPALLARGSRVGSRAVVAQSVLAPAAHLDPGDVARQQFWCTKPSAGNTSRQRSPGLP